MSSLSGNPLLVVEAWPGNRVAPNGYGAPVKARQVSRAVGVRGPGGSKNERHRGARPTVGEGVRAPHRLTIRLSAAQFEALREAARGMTLPRRGLATAARALLVEALQAGK